MQTGKPIGPSHSNFASDATLWNKELGQAFKQDGAGGVQRAFAQVKGWISTPQRSVVDLHAVRDALKGVVTREVNQMADYAAPEMRAAFLAEMKATIDVIFEGALTAGAASRGGALGARVPAGVFRQAVMAANENAQEALIRLERQSLAAEKAAGPTGMAPQVVIDSNHRIQVIRTAPALENLVLRGGGAKGVGYGPALMEMEKEGLLGGLRQVVGTSAGALTATCLAAGFNAREFASLSSELGTARLTSDVASFDTRYPDIQLGGGGIYSGQGALLELDHATARSVGDFLAQHWATEDFQGKLASRLTPDDVARLATLREPRLGQQDDRMAQMVTFRDLRLLHQLEPARFRELSLTGWDSTLKEETYFNADNSPNMPVALAGRISMSLPGLFDAVRYDPQDGRQPRPGRLDALRQSLGLGGNPSLRTFKDGGIGSNVPSEVITRGKSGVPLEEARARTAVLVFDELGKAHDQIYTRRETRPVGALKQLKRWATRVYNETWENPNYVRDARNDTLKARDAGVNAYVVYHGDIGTSDVGASAARVGHAQRDASLRMLQQVRARAGQAYMVEYQTARDCFAALTPRERSALLAAGRPDPSGETSTKLFRFKLALYELAQQEAPAGLGA